MKSIKYILALLLIIPAGFVFAQTIVTVSQPVATSWNDFGGTKLTSLSQANTPHLNDNVIQILENYVPLVTTLMNTVMLFTELVKNMQNKYFILVVLQQVHKTCSLVLLMFLVTL